MTITYIGQVPVATLSPWTTTFSSAVQAAYAICGPSVSLPLADAQRLLAQLLTTPTLPNYAGMLSNLQAELVALTNPLQPPPLPTVAAQLPSLQQLAGILLAQLGQLQGTIALQNTFNAVLSSGGIFFYAYSGPVSALGSGMTSQLAAGFPGTTPGALTNALVLAAVDPVSYGAMKSVFGLPAPARTSSPTTTFLGSVTVGTILPIAQQISNLLTKALHLALPSMQTQYAGLQRLITFLIANPPSLASMIADVKQMIATLQGLLALPQPPIGFDLAALEALISRIGVNVGSMTTNLNTLLALASTLTAGGLFSYLYSGATNSMGTELTSQLASGFPGGAAGDHCDAIVVAAVSGSVWATMQTVFGGAPPGISLPATPPMPPPLPPLPH